MTLRGHKKRLSILKAALPRKSNPEEEAALSRIISYLDRLAARKASGDMLAQQEIESVCIHEGKYTLQKNQIKILRL